VLLTYRRSTLFFVEKSRIHARRLAERFGPERVVHRIVDYDDVFRTVLLGDLAGDVRRFHLHLAYLTCLACKLAMHARTVLYDLSHGIGHACDGSSHREVDYPEQVKPVLAELRTFYADWGIEYSNPVFDREETDVAVHGLGLSSRKFRKDYENFIYETQPSCPFGGITYVWSNFVLMPLVGQEGREALAVRYLQRKRPVLDRYIAAHRDDPALAGDEGA
jgi:hypothetical protein